jgi:hypothetical protein
MSWNCLLPVSADSNSWVWHGKFVMPTLSVLRLAEPFYIKAALMFMVTCFAWLRIQVVIILGYEIYNCCQKFLAHFKAKSKITLKWTYENNESHFERNVNYMPIYNLFQNSEYI